MVVLIMILLMVALIIWGFLNFRVTENENQEILNKYLANKRKAVPGNKKEG